MYIIVHGKFNCIYIYVCITPSVEGNAYEFIYVKPQSVCAVHALKCDIACTCFEYSMVEFLNAQIFPAQEGLYLSCREWPGLLGKLTEYT